MAYLDAYQTAGGELPTSVELTEDIEGVRLMTLYQAKGLEFPIVFVPSLLEGEWPTREGWGGFFPKELLREAIPDGDVHTEEERRLLYVAMTRAQERLVLLTHGGTATTKRPSLFVDATLDVPASRRARGRRPDDDRQAARRRTPATSRRRRDRRGRPRWSAGSCHCRRPASVGSRCGCVRASSSACWRRPTPRRGPEGEAARERFARELEDVGRSAAMARRRRLARPGSIR